MRNHGDSSHNQRHDYTALAEDIEHFIQNLRLQNPTLIGHSMGAKTVMTVALRNRVPIANLILVDNAPVDAALHSSFAKYIQGMRRISETTIRRQSEADAILKDYEESLPIRQFLLGNLVRSADGAELKWQIPIRILANALDRMADFPFTDPDEVRYEGPTLVVRGMRSKYVADEMLPVVGRFFPKFELCDVDAGHWVISEKPEEFRKGRSLCLNDIFVICGSVRC